jgi:hypothetical protein
MSLDINLTNVQSKAIVVSTNQTAVNDAIYTVVANATFTDPSPVEGKGYRVFVRNATATINAVAYTEGTTILRLFHSGSWTSYVSLPDSNFVPTSRTINGYNLSANRTLTASDVGAPSGSGSSTGTNTGDETQASILSKLGIWNIQDQTSGTASSGTTLTITKSIALPSVPSFLNFRAVFFKTNSNGAYTVRAYLSEVDNNIGGTAIQIAVVTGANAAVNNLPMKRTFDIIGGNIIGLQAGNSQVTDDINSSSVRLNTPIPTGTPLYLIFTVQCVNASDSARFESIQLNNFSF